MRILRVLPPLPALELCQVLRALDTIEDDMEAFKYMQDTKCRHLRAFGRMYLGDASWSMSGVGESSERELLEGFGAVSRVFNRLPEQSRTVIRDITNRMGDGMARYVGADLGQGTEDLAAYALYCHMVAGLVGEGLSRLFVGRGFESESLFEQGSMIWPFCSAPASTPKHTLGLANSMGLFLQKTNIIRDYLEDYADGRAFWPQEVWRRFARSSELGEFARPTAHGAGLRDGAYDAAADPQGASVVGKGCRTSALACLNFLVADALELVPDSLDYLARLTTPEVFRFCAIPQARAAGPTQSAACPKSCHARAMLSAYA